MSTTLDNSTVYKVADLEPKCALWRFRCPLSQLQDLHHNNSKYSPDFMVANVPWRFHIQLRQDPSTSVMFLAIHLQCLTNDDRGTFGHFKLTVVNQHYDTSKEKTFHCHFKKYGSAWGLHHFIEYDRITNPSAGFIDFASSGSYDGFANEFDLGGRRQVFGSAAESCIVIDGLIRVMDPESDGTYPLGNLPSKNTVRGSSTNTASNSRSPQNTRGQQQGNGALTVTNSSGGAQPQPPYAVLQYPYEDALCDMTISLVNNTRVACHRCIIACRVPRLIPDDMNPLPEGAVIVVDALMEVFRVFLRYVYTEEPPERGTLRPEYLLDLYMMAMRHELFGLAEACIVQVVPLLTHENILPIIASRYAPTDETLNALYLRVLLSSYDRLIEEEHFENLPGQLNRHLSLIMRGKEPLPNIQCPKAKSNLSSNLGLLAESGVYSDYELVLHDGTHIRCHRVVLASRSLQFNQAFYKNDPSALPRVNSQDFAFNAIAWSRFLVSLYRGTSAPLKEMSPEDVVLVWKMTDALGLDGRLRRESEPFINPTSAMRIMVYSEKHNVAKLRDVALRMVAANFPQRLRSDPSMWDLIAELPHGPLLNLFRTVMGAAQ